MNLRNLPIYLRLYWPVVPAAAATFGLGWLFWGMSPWISLMLPAAAGVLVFFFFAFILAWVS